MALGALFLEGFYSLSGNIIYNLEVNKILFVTTNKDKLLIAQTVCAKFGLEVEQVHLEIDEIQGENPKLIVEDKARKAYENSRQPVVVSDDSWDIPTLNGFPGPYMKSINKWFTPQNFIELMRGKEDREVILHQYLAYYDGKLMKVFNNNIHGQIIDKPRIKAGQPANMTVTVLDHDNGRTIGEVFEQGAKAVEERYLSRRDAWHVFAEWYVKSKR